MGRPTKRISEPTKFAFTAVGGPKRPSAAASVARRPSLDSPAGDLGEMGWLDRLGEQYPAPGSGGSGDE